MNWLFRILGVKSKLEKDKQKLKKLREKAYEAQQNGKLSLAGKYLTEAEALETTIVDEEANHENR